MQGPHAHELQQNLDVTLGEGLCFYLAILSSKFIIMDGRESKWARSSVGMAWAGAAAGTPPEELRAPTCQAWDLSQVPLWFVLQQLTPFSASLT